VSGVDADMDKDAFETASPAAEPGMNLISVDFELVMVNRANERLYGKSMVALLGKKCYSEFERRDAPCPHCPGLLALATGRAHETETEGVRDDGSRFAARIRAHPVMGPDNRPTGFIEVVEDITEQKRMENLARIDADLFSTLTTAQNTQRALRETAEAALRVEGIDSGCVFLLGQAGTEPSLVFQRGFAPQCLQALGGPAASWTSDGDSGDDLAPLLAEIEGAPRALALVPILYRGERVAIMAVGTSAYPDIPPTLRAGLKNLGATAGTAIARIRAEQSRGDAVADLETVITNAPVAAWTLDPAGRVTMWNKAAERLFGWTAAEILQRPSPFPDAGLMTRPDLAAACVAHETSLVAKDGRVVEVRLVASAFRDVVGKASTTIVMAEDLSLERRVVELESRLLSLGHDFSADSSAEPGSRPSPAENRSGAAANITPPARILVIDADEPRGRELAKILGSLGHEASRYGSVAEAAGLAAGVASGPEGRSVAGSSIPFDLAIVDVVAPDGTSALSQKAALRGLGMTGPVIVSSDSEIRGHEQHGFAAAVRRPYTAQALAESVRKASLA
jgi:PAS domain S-box-containing protein